MRKQAGTAPRTRECPRMFCGTSRERDADLYGGVFHGLWRIIVAGDPVEGLPPKLHHLGSVDAFVRGVDHRDVLPGRPEAHRVDNVARLEAIVTWQNLARVA